MKFDESTRATLVALVGALVIFVLVFFGLKAILTPSEHVVNGVLVQAANPHDDIAAALSSKFISEHIIVQNESEIIPGRSAAAAEIASALATSGKNVTVQGSVRGEYCVNERREQVECKRAQVLIYYGTCNCLRVQNSALHVEGTDTWMLENAHRMRGIIRWALQKQ